MSVVVQFPDATPSKGLQRIQASYSIRDIRRLFGWSESTIRRWMKEKIVCPVEPSPEGGELQFDFHALEVFRRARELKNRGLPLRRIEAELSGQLPLFPEAGAQGRLLQLPVRRSSFEEALALHDEGDQRAVELYMQAIQDGECVADAYCNLGILAYETRDIPRAFDHFTNALKSDPRHFEAHFNLAHLYFEAEDVRLARLHYDISAVIEPGNASVHFNLGLVNAVERKIPAAVASLNKARECAATEEEMVQIDEILAGLRNAPDAPACDV
ncbi:MAG: MerR family transcriptional regulator [Acidobacteriota bacterium]|jgi:tetratricopeptide (TPR) repeat protein|nr:MerR family transcriptional regulator [Acidobacteriota bacterium]